MKDQISEVIQNPKAAAGVAGLTAGSGAGDWFGWIPHDIGKFGVLIGAVLSTVLIVVHVHQHYMAWKEHQKKMRGE
jgi:hypothetical protein